MIDQNNLINLGLKSQQDCLLFIMPPVLPIAPPPAIPKLVAIAREMKLKVQACDLNIHLWHLMPDLRFTWEQNSSFFDEQKYGYDEVRIKLDSLLEKWAQQIVTAGPAWVGFSCLFSNSIPLLQRLISHIKNKNAGIKIMLGGSALDSVDIKILIPSIDEVVRDNGEIKFLELLSPGITPQSEKEKNIPFITTLPDYSDFNVQLYSSQPSYKIETQTTEYGLKTLFIKGSQGCVRECTFCNENIINPRFLFKTGKIIGEEIMHFHKSLGVENFFFVDSLVNGSMKSFIELNSYLTLYNSQIGNKLNLTGYMICRGEKEFPSEVFDSMKSAGFKKVVLGVETGSEKIRREMKKGYTIQDLNWFLSELNRVGILCELLLMVGYPTETQDDFQQTLDMLDHFHAQGWLGPNKMINTANFGWTTTIVEGTQLSLDAFAMGMENPVGALWSHTNKYQNNRGQKLVEINNPAMRIIRHRLLHSKLSELGIIGRTKKPHINSLLMNLLTTTIGKNSERYSDEELNTMVRNYSPNDDSHFYIGEIIANIFYVQDRTNGESYIVNI